MVLGAHGGVCNCPTPLKSCHSLLDPYAHGLSDKKNKGRKHAPSPAACMDGSRTSQLGRARQGRTNKCLPARCRPCLIGDLMDWQELKVRAYGLLLHDMVERIQSPPSQCAPGVQASPQLHGMQGSKEGACKDPTCLGISSCPAETKLDTAQALGNMTFKGDLRTKRCQKGQAHRAKFNPDHNGLGW
eukprot:1159756-Pelagomonas_calceolata.AAC.20